MSPQALFKMVDEGALAPYIDGTNSSIQTSKRPFCNRCKRPKKVCLCEAIPETPVAITTTVYVLQHPEEKHRLLTTVPLLSACLPTDKCIVYNDVRYSQDKYPELHKLLKSPLTLVLYPDPSATDLREVVKDASPGEKFNLVVPDGTWRQAKRIYKVNDVLQKARKVQLNENIKSRYVIRTQPTKNSLSTLEAIAVSLSILEGSDEIAESSNIQAFRPQHPARKTIWHLLYKISTTTKLLVKPLQLLCQIQLQYGAVPHSSKEEKKELHLQHKLELEKQAAIKQKCDESEPEDQRVVKKSKLDG